MAFQKAVINLMIEKKLAGTLQGLHFEIHIYDNAYPNMHRVLDYEIKDTELAALSTNKTTRKSEIKAILKREIKKEYQLWIQDMANMPPAPTVTQKDAMIELGVKEIKKI